MSPEGVNIGSMFDFTTSRGRGGLCSESQIRLSICTETKRDCKALAITIGSEVMAQMRWVAGDRVSVAMNPAKSEATIYRVQEDAKVPKWRLLPRSDNYKGDKGKCIRTAFSIVARKMMLEAFGMDDRMEYVPEVIVTGPEGITFPLAKQWKVVSRKTG